MPLVRSFNVPAGLRKATPAAYASKRFFRSDLVGTDVYRQHKKDDCAEIRAMEYADPLPPTVKVAVTGGAGAIGYSLLFRIASGEMFGKRQRVQIRCLELPMAMNALQGVAMELTDCAFPMLDGIFCTDDMNRAFDDIDYALLVGSKPRGPGMERGDLIRDNGAIFEKTGKALNKWARKSARIVVVGNPCNTNCLIAANNAPNIPMENFSAMTRLDHDRSLGQLAKKAKCSVKDIEKFCIWGNHSPTMYPDISNCTIKGQSAMEALKAANPSDDMEKWYKEDFMPTIQQRGAAIIKARGASSAASAANAGLMHARDLELGTNGSWQSMAVHSNGEYGVAKDLFFSYPVTTEGGNWKIVSDVPELSAFSQEKIKATEKELLAERDFVAKLLPN